MRDAVITVRMPSATRQRLERLAARDGRSLSRQIERLLEQAMDEDRDLVPPRPSRQARSLAGSLAGGRVPTLADFREIRSELSEALERRTRDPRRR